MIDNSIKRAVIKELAIQYFIGGNAVNSSSENISASLEAITSFVEKTWDRLKD